MTISLLQYQDRFPNIRLERRGGVLQVSLHSNGGTLKWGATAGSIHAQLPEALYRIGRDPDNKVVILTGTGDAFCQEFDFSQIKMPTPEFMSEDLYPIFREGRDILVNLLEIEAPVIGVVNGPAWIHAELLVLSDVVLANKRASFADKAHFVNGVVPGDGANVVWPALLGPNRGRHFLLSGAEISATKALELGFVAEVLPTDRLLPRAWEMALDFASKPRRTLQMTRTCFTQPWRKRMHDELGYGLMLEMGAVEFVTSPPATGR
ncbi:MAG: enoyl-CoA hydratase/isomerase family protein [Pseudomonadota bacterium]|jgi:enoyl-CoA hydratase/carnithine racemase|nr:enoyl-CoA hydratase/isomerase family protein [Pseudomonadota bacterium]